MKIFKILGLVILVIIAIPVIVVVLFIFFLIIDIPCDPTLITKFDVGNKRSISIYKECGWFLDEGTSIYLDAREADKVVIPLKIIEVYDHDIYRSDFQVIYAENQSLVGVYDRTGLFSDVIIVDFKTGKAWPPDYYNGSYDYRSYDYNEKADLHRRLRDENPNLFPTPTPPRPTPIPPRPTPTATNTIEPTSTSTLVVQPTYYNTPEP
ncbi:MAG: hypothetical protein GY797_11060 [Deltaproteobacteria bacterium]|nr:hypothetical protein [Deltaproteobacteria bacterium]